MVEYSELDQSLASAINQTTGRLRFCWSNVLSLLLCLPAFKFFFSFLFFRSSILQRFYVLFDACLFSTHSTAHSILVEFLLGFWD